MEVLGGVSNNSEESHCRGIDSPLTRATGDDGAVAALAVGRSEAKTALDGELGADCDLSSLRGLGEKINHGFSRITWTLTVSSEGVGLLSSEVSSLPNCGD